MFGEIRPLRQLFGARGPSRPASRKPLGFEACEPRMLMHGGGCLEHDADAMEHAEGGAFGSSAYVSTAQLQKASDNGVVLFTPPPTANRWGDIVGTLPAEIYDPFQNPSEWDDYLGLPKLNSLPGAAATLYLDFNGNYEPDWWYGDGAAGKHFYKVSTPTFSMDADPWSFNAEEKAAIKEIWARVAEDYAPFNINVSTAYYGGFADRQALRVAIGGSDQDWLKQSTSGFASINSFSQPAPNTVFVFDLTKWEDAGVSDSEGNVINGIAAIANTASHEAGHAFGLEHASLYNVKGQLMDEYHKGTSGWTPIMGNNKASDRTTWNAGTTIVGPNSYQDDVAILAGATNGFGLRPDDHGSNMPTAHSLSVPLSIYQPMTSKGIVNSYADIDAFKFTTSGGRLQINVKAAALGPNLIPVAQLWTASGWVANANGGSLTESIINTTVPAGTYYVMVHGYGDYGDMGQYTVAVADAQHGLPVTAGKLGQVSAPPTTTLSTPNTSAKGAGTAKRTATVAGSTGGAGFGASAITPQGAGAAPGLRLVAKAEPAKDAVNATLDAAFGKLGRVPMRRLAYRRA